jgi:hypothetical protein
MCRAAARAPRAAPCSALVSGVAGARVEMAAAAGVPQRLPTGVCPAPGAARNARLAGSSATPGAAAAGIGSGGAAPPAVLARARAARCSGAAAAAAYGGRAPCSPRGRAVRSVGSPVVTRRGRAAVPAISIQRRSCITSSGVRRPQGRRATGRRGACRLEGRAAGGRSRRPRTAHVCGCRRSRPCTSRVGWRS